MEKNLSKSHNLTNPPLHTETIKAEELHNTPPDQLEQKGLQTDSGGRSPSNPTPRDPNTSRMRECGRGSSRISDPIEDQTSHQTGSRVRAIKSKGGGRMESRSPTRPSRARKQPRGKERGRDRTQRSVIEMWEKMRVEGGRRRNETELDKRLQGDPESAGEKYRARVLSTQDGISRKTDYRAEGQPRSGPRGSPQGRIGTSQTLAQPPVVD